MRYYSKEHLWIDEEKNNAVIGICKYFLIRNTSINYIQVEDTGKEVKAGDSLFTLENDKSLTEFSAPVTGIIVERNLALIESPALLDNLSEEECWVCKIAMEDQEFSSLMTHEEYEAFTS